jgi:peptidyl-prolyl cis-trans isomerase SurA
MRKTKNTIFLALVAALMATGAVANAVDNSAKATAFAADDVEQTAASGDSVAVAEDAPLPENSVVDEVIWVVGDEPILKSEVEIMRLQGEAEGVTWHGDPDCSIPEQIAVQKLFLHQAEIDSIEVSEAEIAQGIDMQINRWIAASGGSKEKLEEYKKMTISQLRQSLHDDFKNNQLVQQMKQKLVEDITVTPADVRKYFHDMPEDSIPFVPTEVEVEIITKQPKISQDEINRVKNELRDYTERVTKGETSFATLARLYSEDPGSARQGGEMDYIGRGMLDPAFAGVAFNLTDPKKISKIVESEYGYHIIQLIDKRGDKIKVRHILRTPKVSTEAIDSTKVRLDSLALDIRNGKVSFEEAASYVSDDKDTRNNHGLMSFNSEDGRTSRFQMKDLPTEVARQVANMQVGEVSPAFRMVNDKNKTVCAIVKLKSRTDAHRATITEDYQVMKKVVLEKERADFLHNWVVNKIKNTYVRMNDRYKDCDFEYQGWVK